MDKVTDEMLVAFADGELDAGQRRDLASRLAEEPELARRLAVFTATGRSLSRFYEQDLQDPIPERLLETLDRYEQPPQAARTSGARSMKASWRHRIDDVVGSFSGQANSWQHALALGLALVAGAALGWQVNSVLQSGSQAETAAIFAQGAFRDALELEPSGGSRQLDATQGNKSSLKPILTFANRNGGFCREYQLTQSKGASFHGVACRNENGSWQVRLHVPERVQSSPESQIVPAGQQKVESVDAVVDDLIVGDVLSPDQEGPLIQGGWQLAQ